MHRSRDIPIGVTCIAKITSKAIPNDAFWGTDKAPNTLWRRTMEISWILLLMVLSYIILVHPAQTILTVMMGDNFIFFDGAYRLAQGQLPSRDFHTPLGVVAFLPGYLGLLISDGFGAAMQLGSLLLCAFLLTIYYITARRRVEFFVFAILAVLICLLCVSPSCYETRITFSDLTFAMSYNRWGWAAYILFLTLYVDTKSEARSGGIIDIFATAILLTFMFYLKISYFIAALGFTMLSLTFPPAKRRIFVAGAILGGVAIILIGWASNILSYYLSDIADAIQVTGLIRGGWTYVLHSLIQNRVELVLAGAVIVLMCIRKDFDSRDLGFGTYATISGVAILNHNGDALGIFSILPVIVLAIVRFNLQTGAGTRSRGLRLANAVISTPVFAFGLFTLSHIIKFAVPLIVVALRVPDMQLLETGLRNVLGKVDSTVLPRETLPVQDYLATLADGVDAINHAPVVDKVVVVLDISNPFSVILKLPPARGDYAFLDYGRVLSDSIFVRKTELFNTASIVMVPKKPFDPETASNTLALYDPYLKQNYHLEMDTKYWFLLARNKLEASGTTR